MITIQEDVANDIIEKTLIQLKYRKLGDKLYLKRIEKDVIMGVRKYSISIVHRVDFIFENFIDECVRVEIFEDRIYQITSIDELPEKIRSHITSLIKTIDSKLKILKLVALNTPRQVSFFNKGRGISKESKPVNEYINNLKTKYNFENDLKRAILGLIGKGVKRL